MAADIIYLDNNATTRPTEGVRQAIATTLAEHWHNPSSVHRPGQAAKHQIELARASAARLVNARPREIIFTSGGTESIELAIRGTIQGIERPVIVTSAIEHAAVRDLLDTLDESCEIRNLPLDASGSIDAQSAVPMLADASLVCLQWANNETGAIQPIAEIGRACRDAGVPLLVDGTQWVGKMPTNLGSGTARETDPAHLDEVGPTIDLMAFSAHKLHGPKGAGALFVRRGTRMGAVRPGSQELGRRGGTENVPGIVGFGSACDEALAFLGNTEERHRLSQLRDRLEHGILERCPDAEVNGSQAGSGRLWNTTNIGFRSLEAEALLLLLSERGVCASAGAACSSGSLEPSPVLLAMGIEPSVAHGSIRLSISRFTSDREIDLAIDLISDAAHLLGSSLPTP